MPLKISLREHRRAERIGVAPVAAPAPDVRCPKCGSRECHPTNDDAVLIRVAKVYDEDGTEWSQCLVCSGGYNNWPEYNAATHDPNKGWFAS